MWTSITKKSRLHGKIHGEGRGTLEGRDCPTEGITHDIRYIAGWGTSTGHPYIMYRGLVEPCDEFAEGLRVVGLQSGKRLVNLCVWRGKLPDEIRYGKVGREGLIVGWRRDCLANPPEASPRRKRLR